MLSRNWLGLFALVPAAALAWGDDCKVRAERNAGIDVAGVEKVVLRTGAGDLKVRGSATAKRIEAKGEACAAKQELLDASQVNVRREGKVVYVETALPQDKSGWSWGNNDYAYIDLGVSLPSGLPVEAIDSSGDAELSDLKSLEMQDSSGDLDIEGAYVCRKGGLGQKVSFGEIARATAGSPGLEPPCRADERFRWSSFRESRPERPAFVPS